ncbi:hypothetical protein OG21DRAFT_159810 [Imleria badia]|nr:hypothetical protein OG21DRAFT_159810 [Imleria badia]
MHRALEIQEILSIIFSHCSREVLTSWVHPPKRVNPDLAALARTCRTFKEPALDLLWRVLFDLSPLARCLPEASHQVFPQNTVRRFLSIRPATMLVNVFCFSSATLVFVHKTAYPDRVGCPSRLHPSHPIHTALQFRTGLEICRHLEPSHHCAIIPKPPHSEL